MAVHFVFAAASKQWESVAVEGDSIALWQLKDEIFNLKFRKAMEKRAVKERFDFRVFDAESKEEIFGARTRVPRHSRVVVKRVPAYVVSKAEEKQQQTIQSTTRLTTTCAQTTNSNSRPIDDGFGDDVFSTVTCVSSDRNDSSATSAPRSWSSHAGETQDVKRRRVVRNNSSKSVSVAQQKEQADVTSAQQKKQADVVTLESSVVRCKVVEIPVDLKCSLCHEIIKDAVLIPCCCTSFCLTCVTDSLVADHKCPSCGSSKCKPADVLPNRSLNACVALHLKINGTSLTPSQVISNTSRSCSSALSEEHKSQK